MQYPCHIIRKTIPINFAIHKNLRIISELILLRLKTEIIIDLLRFLVSDQMTQDFIRQGIDFFGVIQYKWRVLL
jgi:hypothetical protein